MVAFHMWKGVMCGPRAWLGPLPPPRQGCAPQHGTTATPESWAPATTAASEARGRLVLTSPHPMLAHFPNWLIDLQSLPYPV